MTFRPSRRGAVALMGAAALPLHALGGEGGSVADQAFAALGARWLDTMARLSPVSATQLGDHRYDAELDDMSASGRAASTAASRAMLKDLEAMPLKGISRPSQIDAALLANRLRYDIWTDEVLQSWAWDPLIYNELAGDALYLLMARDFAPIAQRLASATSRMEKLPSLYAQARANLVPARVPLIHAQTVARQNKGVSDLVSELILPHAGELPPADHARLEAAAAALTRAVSEHQEWIDGTLVPNAKGSVKLGAELYDAKLAFALESNLSRQEIRRRAEAAVITTRQTMYGLARQVLARRPGAPQAPDAPTPAQQQAVIRAALDIAAADHPAADQVVEAARTGLAKATEFVTTKDLITLPSAPVQVILMPVFQRGVSVAYCDSPGPLDKRLATFYAVSPLPKDWTAARTASFLREYNFRAIDDISTHEAMPGHYVQLYHSNSYPSVLRAVLQSGSFIEGWAVYAETMMTEEGFGDPLYRLVVAKTLLRSVTNAILDQAIHVDGMDRTAAMTLMMDTAFQEEGEAAGKWIRACVSCAQLPFYFVGSEEHWDTRREAEKRWGKDFTLKRYHDTVLSFGSPPGRFVYEAMFEEPIA
jgi:uncharacterized protein (DUF885 family)